MKTGGIPGPDGHLLYQRALRAEYVALAEYSRVLGVFSDLVVNGKHPAKLIDRKIRPLVMAAQSSKF